jgi:glycosyltransferase involved in cell wall biosynthesis
MLVSIITPSFNQSQFLEYCLRSVASERARGDVEHLIVDGGSTDSSIKILQENAASLDFWRSVPDGGQSAAINDGMARAKGNILCWINSDDAIAPGAITVMQDVLGAATGPAWAIGQCLIIDDLGSRRDEWAPTKHDDLDYVLNWRTNYIMQPAVFWNKSMWDSAGPLERNLHYAMDFDLWLRFFRIRKPLLVDKVIGMHRVHGESKTSLVKLQIFDEYLWSLDKRLRGDLLRRRNGRQNVAHALCKRANMEIYYGRYSNSIECLRKGLSVSVSSAMTNASFWKAAIKMAVLRKKPSAV